MLHIAEYTHNVIDHTKHTIETIIHIVDSKEKLGHLFESSGGEIAHEHLCFHAGEMMFSKILMLVGG